MLDATPLQAHLNLPLFWCHLPPVISSPLISSRRGSVQALDEGFCFQDGTKPQPQPCVLEGLVPRPPHFSLGHEPWHKSLAFACALSFERATWHMPGDFIFYTHCSLCRGVAPCAWAGGRATFPATWDTLLPMSVLPPERCN